MAKTRIRPASKKLKAPHRIGRPIAAHAGEVDTRLLDAATQLFFERGFEATSCDQVVVLAAAGKASLYARYANKEALFAAVVRRAVAQTLEPSIEVSPQLPFADRLRTVGTRLLQHILTRDSIAMMRMVIATADRFPELAQLADQIAWEFGVELVSKAIVSPNCNPHALAKPLAARFISIIVPPQQMRALFGDSLASLQAAAPTRVDEAVEMLQQSGWLDDWS